MLSQINVEKFSEEKVKIFDNLYIIFVARFCEDERVSMG